MFVWFVLITNYFRKFKPICLFKPLRKRELSRFPKSLSLDVKEYFHPVELMVIMKKIKLNNWLLFVFLLNVLPSLIS